MYKSLQLQSSNFKMPMIRLMHVSYTEFAQGPAYLP